MLFSSGVFLFLFAIFSLFYLMLRKRLVARIVYVTLFSLYFYYKTSGLFLFLLVGLSISDYAIGHFIYQLKGIAQRRLMLALSITINLGILCYFKYTNFFIDITNNLASSKVLEFQNIFLPIGVSFFTFQSMSYVIDIYRKDLNPVVRWIDYIFYLSFFPQLVAGPIVRAKDFIPQIYQNPILVDKKMYNRGILLIISGLFKKAVISNYISLNFVDRIFDNPTLYSGVENLLGVYGYALQIYCDFSGYSDMAIGIALLLGFKFNKNFDSPYKSATITEFWRRWHISLSSWLKDYLYISLGGNKKGRLRTYLNLFITMLLGGLWHGAAFKFVLWGAIHGTALAIHKLMMQIFPRLKGTGEDMHPINRAIGIFITFHIVCFSWIFFRADNMDIAKEVIHQITYNFDISLLPSIISGYKYILLMMLLGYILHFTPSKYSLVSYKIIKAMPLPIKAVLIVVVIWLVMQIKSTEIQPFIYFQF